MLCIIIIFIKQITQRLYMTACNKLKSWLRQQLGSFIQVDDERDFQPIAIEFHVALEYLQYLGLILPHRGFRYDQYFSIFYQAGEIITLRYDSELIGWLLLLLQLLVIVSAVTPLANQASVKALLHTYFSYHSHLLNLPQITYFLYAYNQLSVIGLILATALNTFSLYFLRDIRLLRSPMRRSFSAFNSLQSLYLLFVCCLLKWDQLIGVMLFSVFLLGKLFDISINQPYSIVENGIRLKYTLIVLMLQFVLMLSFGYNDFSLIEGLSFALPLLIVCFAYNLGEVVSRRFRLRQIEKFREQHLSVDDVLFQIKYVRYASNLEQWVHRTIALKRLLRMHDAVCTQRCSEYLSDGNSQLTRRLIIDIISINIQQKTYSDVIILILVQFYRLEWNEPVLGLMNLKRLMIQTTFEFSFYFSVLSFQIGRSIEEMMQMLIMREKRNRQKLTVDELVTVMRNECLVLEQLRDILAAKSRLLSSELTYAQLEDSLFSLGEKTSRLNTLLERVTSASLNEIAIQQINFVPHLKWLSFYFSAVMNDSQSSYLCEFSAQLILQSERMVDTKKLTNLNYLRHKIAVASVSLVKDQGKILNKNKLLLGRLLGYDASDDINRIAHLHQLLPQSFRQVHDKLVSQFLNKAQSKFFDQFRAINAVSKAGYLIEIDVQFRNDFQNMDDYIIMVAMLLHADKDQLVQFDQAGLIMGIGSKLHHNLFSRSANMQELIDKRYIYEFVPEIFDVVRNQNKAEGPLFDERMFIKFGFRMFSVESTNTLGRKSIFNSNWNQKDGNEQIEEDLENPDLEARIKQQFPVSTLSHCGETVRVRFSLRKSVIQCLDQQITYFTMDILEVLTEEATKTYEQSLQHGSPGFYSQLEAHSQNTLTESGMQMDSNYSRDISERPKNCRLIVGSFDNQLQVSKADFIKPLIGSFPNEDLQIMSIRSSRKQLFSLKESKTSYQMEQTFNMSHRSSTSAGQLLYIQFKHFMGSSQTSKNLKWLLALSCFVCLSVISNMIALSSYMDQSGLLITKNSKFLLAPLRCNRYFSKQASLGGILILQALGQLNESEYFMRLTAEELNQFKTSMPPNMSDIIKTAQVIEADRIIALDLVSANILFVQNNITFNYQKLINYLYYNGKRIYDISIDQADNPEVVLHREFVNAVLALQANLRNLFEVNNSLIAALQLHFERNFSFNSDFIVQLLLIYLSLLLLVHALKIVVWLYLFLELNQILSIFTSTRQDLAEKELQRLQDLAAIISEPATQTHLWIANDFFQMIQAPPSQPAQMSYKTLNAKVKGKHLRVRAEFVLAFVEFAVCLMFQFGAKFLFDEQQLYIEQFLSMTTSYVRFSSQVDILIASMQILKTQPLLLRGLQESELLTQAEYQQIAGDLSFFHLYNQLSQQFSQKLQDVAGELMSNEEVRTANREILELFNANICKIIHRGLPFCEYQESRRQEFVQKYGEFNERDNNLEFLSLGLIGMVTRVQKYCTEYFEYESRNLRYVSDLDELKRQAGTSNFNQVVLTHFRDNFLAIVTLLNMLLRVLEIRIRQQQRDLLVYFGVVGAVVLSFQILLNVHLLLRTKNRMKKIKLSLSLIPASHMINPSTLAKIKQIYS